MRNSIGSKSYNHQKNKKQGLTDNVVKLSNNR